MTKKLKFLSQFSLAVVTVSTVAAVVVSCDKEKIKNKFKKKPVADKAPAPTVEKK